MILARYINSYQDEMALSQAEDLYLSKEDAIKDLKSEGYTDDELDIDTSNCDKYGWEFQEISVTEVAK